jgi:hypothetical protein
MPQRVSLRCNCGCEFSVPANVPVGSLVPCPRCSLTLRISHVPTTTPRARPVNGGAHRPPSYHAPKKRLGVPTAPGHVALRRDQSEVLVNYGLWTLLFGVLLTLTPIIPIDSATWDRIIAYQPWAGIIIAISGVMMMIAYQSGPDFARGPGAPVLVAAFWMVGITLAVFSGWIADRARLREENAKLAEAKAPVIQPQAPPLARFDPQRGGNEAPTPNPPPTNVPPKAEPPKSDPPKSDPLKPGRDPFGISDEGKTVAKKPADDNRTYGNVLLDLQSTDKAVLLQALDEIIWYYKHAKKPEVGPKLAALLTHKDEEILLAALKALKTWADDEQAAALVPLATHDSASIRELAIEMLGRFPTPEGLAILVDRLEIDTEIAKRALLRAGKAAEAPLRKGLKSKEKIVRLECLKIVDASDIKQALREVRSMAQFDKDGEVKAEAQRVADKLARKKE